VTNAISKVSFGVEVVDAAEEALDEVAVDVLDAVDAVEATDATDAADSTDATDAVDSTEGVVDSTDGVDSTEDAVEDVLLPQPTNAASDTSITTASKTESAFFIKNPPK